MKTATNLEEYKMVVNIFGATASPNSTNFVLQQCARDNGDEVDVETISTVLLNFYVDNCLMYVKVWKVRLQH